MFIFQTRWGSPASGEVNSGLGFQGTKNTSVVLTSSGTGPATTSSDFYLGQLTHFNYPVYWAASATELNVILDLKTASGQLVATTTFKVNFSFFGNMMQYPFLIDETANQTPPPCAYPSAADNPCADKIYFQTSYDFSKSFRIGQVNYTLQILGFKETSYSNSPPITYFISQVYNSTHNIFRKIKFPLVGYSHGYLQPVLRIAKEDLISMLDLMENVFVIVLELLLV